ncbi:MAG: hypothetical protein AB8H79_06050 [Myxococcota bacterium]
MRCPLALGLLLTAAPTLADDRTEDSEQEPAFAAPPESAEFTKPIWPAHLSPAQHYQRGRTEKGIGIGLTVTGTTFAVGGLVLGGLALQSLGSAGLQGDELNYQPLFFGVLAISAGVVATPFLAGGIPLWRHGDRRMIQAQPFLLMDLESSLAPHHVGLKLNGQF